MYIIYVYMYNIQSLWCGKLKKKFDMQSHSRFDALKSRINKTIITAELKFL